MEVVTYPETAFEKLPATIVPAAPTKTPPPLLSLPPARDKNGMAAGLVMRAAQTRLPELFVVGLFVQGAGLVLRQTAFTSYTSRARPGAAARAFAASRPAGRREQK